MTLRAPSATRRWFPWFKWTLYGLLAINVALFLRTAAFVEGLDALTWLVLLMLFEWETSRWEHYDLPKWEVWLAHALRFIAYGVVLYCLHLYARQGFIDENGWTPLWNAGTWIFIVVMLEYDVLRPGHYLRWWWQLRNSIKALLYGSLLAYALLWAAQGYWLDFYDALLWMLCFFAIELNLFEFQASVDEDSESEPVLDALEAEAPASID